MCVSADRVARAVRRIALSEREALCGGSDRVLQNARGLRDGVAVEGCTVKMFWSVACNLGI